MELFDTHCHLDLDAFDPDRMQVLADARAAGVRHLLIPGTTRNHWDRLWTLCASDPALHPAVGLHPVLLGQHGKEDIGALEAFVKKQRPIAIGEIGLDHLVADLDRNGQQELLEGQLLVAEKHRLPIVLHVRKAHGQLLQTLKEFNLAGGICHAFNGSLQQARQYMEMGFKLGLGGMLTYENARKLHKLARELPLEGIVLETDAPDMSGSRHRYQRNSPAYLPETLQKLALLRHMPTRELAEITTANGKSVLGIGQCL